MGRSISARIICVDATLWPSVSQDALTQAFAFCREWAKHTDFDIATKTPMLLKVPGVTDQRSFQRHASDGFVELVDVMPTLADYAGISVPSTCPINPSCTDYGCSSASTMVRLCTEGQSLRTIVDRCAAGTSNCDSGKAAAFSQYPHYTGSNPYHQANGYTITTELQGIEWRYTEWVPFDVPASVQWNQPDYNPGRWDEITSWCDGNGQVDSCDGARELYNHHTDPDENTNVAEQPGMSAIVVVLARQLHNGWRPAMFLVSGGGH